MRLKHALVAALAAAALLMPARSARAEAHAWAVSGLAGYGQFSEKLKYPSDSLADTPIHGGSSAVRLEARNVLSIPHENWSTANKADQQYWGGLTYGWGGKPKDTDLDGVPDKKDKCPNTPKGATVDATGCPVDSDGDGVFDGLDQ